MGRRSSWSVIFHINRSKLKKGKHPIIMRISINSTVATLYTKQYILSEHWDVRKNRVFTEHDQASAINDKIDKLESLARYHYKRILSESSFITADMVKQILVRDAAPVTLLEVFKLHNASYRKRVGKDRAFNSWQSYETIYSSVERFIRLQYNIEDIALKKLDINFINDYEFYLRITNLLSPCTVRNRIMLLWKIVRLAVSKGLLNRDPFLGYTPERIKRNDDFLTEEEFEKILSLNIQESNLCFIRDLFVFSAFTGLAYCDIESLRPEHICRSTDGELWILKKRENTGMKSKIILFDIPARIIRKYEPEQKGNKIFNVPDRVSISRYMRIISHEYGFDRNIIFRMARPCFAGLITLKHGIPVETVSRMMGYALAEAAGKFININKQKVANDMEELNWKMEGLYKLQDFSSSDMEKSKELFDKMKSKENQRNRNRCFFSDLRRFT